MAARARALALLALAAGVAFVPAAAPALKSELVRAEGPYVVVDNYRLLRGDDPVWSPDGSQLAYVRGGDIWTANADGSGARPITATPALSEGEPEWSPDGRRLAFSLDGQLLAVPARGGRAEPLGAGTHPSWARDGRLAYELDGVIHAGTTPLVPGVDPAWSPDGRALAFVRDGEPYRVDSDGTDERKLAEGVVEASDPVWSPAGRRVAYVTPSEIAVVDANGGTPAPLLASGREPDWANVPTARELLPDLAQRAPAQISVTRHGRRRVLAFRSAVENVGQGALWVSGVRRRGERLMRATQLVRRTDGSLQRLPEIGRLRYDRAPTHSHWHFQPFERYELYRAGDAAPLVRDRKQGFCFGDRNRTARAVPPRFVAGDCGLGNPEARRVSEGTSVGYVDIYPPMLHGQWVDVTGLRDGRYVLLHRANPEFGLRERDYTNNVAGVLLRLRGGSVQVLGRCNAPAVCR